MLTTKTRVNVKSWFQDKTLNIAENLLEKEDYLVIHYRSACAILFPESDGHCLINFEKAPQIPQGFRPATIHCSICSHPQKSGDRCVHAAVLTIKTLLENGLDLTPAPLLFAESRWQQLGAFMSEQGGSPGIAQDAGNSHSLAFKTDEFSALISLSKGLSDLLPILFPKYQFPENSGSLKTFEGPVQNAWKQLLCLCRSSSEKSLNDLGRNSKGQEEAKSLWTQVCHHLFMEQPGPNWRLHRSLDNHFSLLSGPLNESRLQLTPCREETIRFLRQTGAIDLITITGRARAYSKIFFQEDGSLKIEPWIELDNGNKKRRRELNDYIFGSLLSTEGNIFQDIQEQEDDFSPEAKSNNLPLLAFAKKTSPTKDIIIQASEVPSFLDRHLKNILNGNHDAEPALKKFSINDLPDFIEVENYYEDDDWCYLSARYACGSRHLYLRDILALRQEGREHAAGKGEWLLIKNTPLDWLYNLGPERFEDGPNHSLLRLTKLEMMALTSLVPDLKLPENAINRQRIQSLLANLESSELAEADIPKHLRRYQKTGLAWLNHLYENGIGGILADEMGLGKTHQALALLQLALRSQDGPALVVCPTSVLPHWQDKIDSFYPGLGYKVYYGQQRSISLPGKSELLLTTYGVMRQDIEQLAQIPFGLIFFDEVQYLKNHQTATSKAAAHLLGLVRIGLSGTPIENSLTDLKSIYDLCLPGLLGGHSSFQRTYVTPIEEAKDQRRLDSLKRLISPFMLRRHKSTVLEELPEIIEDVRSCCLSADQQNLYQQALDGEGQKLLEAARDTAKPFPHLSFLALVQQLKQICNHPAQLENSTKYEQYSSGKWELFKEILNEVLEAGMKVVVFSQYTTMLDIIEQYLRDANIPHTGLRGSTPVNKRQKEIESFNSGADIRVFCASLLAGGTGIDLTSAQAVIHYDRWWNSAREEQATARVHRFGQKKAVQVFKFLTRGTLEEKIHRIISKKQDLVADALQSDDGSIIKKLSRDEITSILQWGPDIDQS